MTSSTDSSSTIVLPESESERDGDTRDSQPGPAEPHAATSAAPAKSSAPTMSILALSLGIASLIFAQTVVVPLAAVILGVFGLRDEPAGRGFAIWGIVLACVATFGWVFIVVAGALFSLPFILLGAAF
ncbi:DUF4190 domain-containing protein [Salinibacterium sp. SWN167]|uniref:DUF4190 domain-containing protein n=1 Tax=Salinibacterium sp. SWN167 TaxID=2792054 RepID=UPI0018CE869E|nr:DUF4190 domain-containing protein [Salinibacterium sp. SWN167]MBH0083260.1 DUF4190 domain-containing protein [Salinibacterium sp. SWN167]